MGQVKSDMGERARRESYNPDLADRLDALAAEATAMGGVPEDEEAMHTRIRLLRRLAGYVCD